MQLNDVATKAGLIPLDLINAFKPYSPKNVNMPGETWDPWHPNAKGHMIIAEYIFKTIYEKGDIKELLQK